MMSRRLMRSSSLGTIPPPWTTAPLSSLRAAADPGQTRRRRGTAELRRVSPGRGWGCAVPRHEFESKDHPAGSSPLILPWFSSLWSKFLNWLF
jgi:hypothetical protein